MKRAQEIRDSLNAQLEHFLVISKRDNHLELSPILVSIYAALMEIAAQLAEMNERNAQREQTITRVGMRDFTPGGKPLE